MPENVFARIKQENQLFKDETVLYPDFLPERLWERDQEVQEIAFALKPASTGGKPRNVFVYGPPGTGKTATIRFVLKQLQEYSGKAKTVLVNCFETNSRHSVLSFLANAFGAIVPKRGVGSEETYSELLSVWKRSKIVPIIVLDEADQLLSSEEGSKLLYDLLRVSELQGTRTGVIIVSNDSELLVNLDERVKSSLSPQSLFFEKYSPVQLKIILEERTKKAFFSNVLEKEVIPLAAGHAARMGGDCRVGIECLLAAGREAEKQNSSQLTPKHLQLVFDSVDKVSLEKRLNYLNAAETGVLQAIARHNGLTTGDLFVFFQDETEKSLGERMFRAIISKLEQMRLIEAKSLAEGIKGKTRRLTLLVNKEKVLKLKGV
ncbi:AAA family ATPase [Candidatus Micrarchaeota archaeon]|nr:AAA family ATPase [Candidatus Micrarchaeota archaeon]MBU1930229.1 AAA family ATPase [Candidatus Micrarchaeota archaeon]